MAVGSEGYVTDIGYTYGMYAELNPLRIPLAFVGSGLAFPEIGTACELGFGQGMSINAHAAATITQWHGTDFNPDHAAFARSLALATGTDVQLYDQSFAEFCQRADLPDFDFICLHGIWSWISDENRRLIVDFLRRKLKAGGVLYISYNALPGMGAMVPLRKLLHEHGVTMPAAGTGARVAGALGFMDQVLASGSRYMQDNPVVKAHYETLRGMDPAYLAHEYFNHDWQPMSCSDLANWLAPAGLSIACPATLLDHVDTLHLAPQQIALLAGIGHPGFRQSVRDFMLSRQFRKDYWVRGPRQLAGREQIEQLARLRIVLGSARDEVPARLRTQGGERLLTPDIYGPVLDVLADYRPHSLGGVMEALGQRLNWGQLLQAVAILTGMSRVHPAQDDASASKVRQATRRLNHELCRMAHSSNEFQYLISPVTGSALGFERMHQLFAAAYRGGARTEEQLAAYGMQVASSQRQRLTQEGSALNTPEEILAATTASARLFLKRLPLNQQLGLLD